MSETPLKITNLNDFIFCPASIYFHQLEEEEENIIAKDSYQLNGTNAHEKVDDATYSTRKNILQGLSVFSDQYNLVGKIDMFDCEKGVLTERKKKIVTIYDGYVFQLYAQYFCLKEMGYAVTNIRLYSMDDNKVYNVALPENNTPMFEKFKKTIDDMQKFTPDDFVQGNAEKCKKCIYEPLCAFSEVGRI